MANEIQADWFTGRTLYAQVRNSVGQIWNTAGSAFQAYQTANIADYDIALTEQGTASGYYAGNFPAAVAGVYGVVVKERAGGSPAETDNTVNEGDIQWTGNAVRSLSAVVLGNEAHGGESARLALGSSTSTSPLSIISTGSADAVLIAATDGLTTRGVAIAGGGSGSGVLITTGAAAVSEVGAALHLMADGATDVLLGNALMTWPTNWGSSLLAHDVGNGRTISMYLQGLSNRIAFDAAGTSWTLYATDDVTPLKTGTSTRNATSVGPLREADPA